MIWLIEYPTYIDSVKVAHIFFIICNIQQFCGVRWDGYVVHHHQGAVQGRLQEVGLVLLSQVTQDILQNKQASVQNQINDNPTILLTKTSIILSKSCTTPNPFLSYSNMSCTMRGRAANN